MNNTLTSQTQKPAMWSVLDPAMIEADDTARAHFIGEDCDQKQIIDAYPDFTPGWFSPSTAAIIEAAGRLRSQSKPVNIISITDELRDSGKLDYIGGAYALHRAGKFAV